MLTTDNGYIIELNEAFTMMQ
ncbi:unnamed protein product, partial [Rotaria magnacalcarata]